MWASIGWILMNGSWLPEPPQAKTEKNPMMPRLMYAEPKQGDCSSGRESALTPRGLCLGFELGPNLFRHGSRQLRSPNRVGMDAECLRPQRNGSSGRGDDFALPQQPANPLDNKAHLRQQRARLSTRD